MKFPTPITGFAVAGALVMSAAGAAAQPAGQLQSAPMLEQDDGKGDSWTYRNPDVSLAKFQRFLILPTVISTDPTAQWSSTTPEAKQKYAAYMTKALRDEIGKGYQLADRPGKGVATMQLTLLGVKKTVGIVATASRFSPMGLALNSVQSLRGKKGSMTGSVHAALEISDSQSKQLVFAAVRQRAPNAMDIESTLSTEKTVEAVADDIARAVRMGLDKANGR